MSTPDAVALTPSPKRLQLPSALREQLEAFARAGYPDEACGLLIGRTAGGAVRIERLTSARNLNRTRARDRYELDPRDFLAADREARSAGLEIVGIWHTHPDHPARPSETDRAAAWTGYSYVIVSVSARDVAEMRSWRLAGEEFHEETIEA